MDAQTPSMSFEDLPRVPARTSPANPEEGMYYPMGGGARNPVGGLGGAEPAPRPEEYPDTGEVLRQVMGGRMGAGGQRMMGQGFMRDNGYGQGARPGGFGGEAPQTMQARNRNVNYGNLNTRNTLGQTNLKRSMAGRQSAQQSGTRVGNPASRSAFHKPSQESRRTGASGFRASRSAF